MNQYKDWTKVLGEDEWKEIDTIELVDLSLKPTGYESFSSEYRLVRNLIRKCGQKKPTTVEPYLYRGFTIFKKPQFYLIKENPIQTINWSCNRFDSWQELLESMIVGTTADPQEADERLHEHMQSLGQLVSRTWNVPLVEVSARWCPRK